MNYNVLKKIYFADNSVSSIEESGEYSSSTVEATSEVPTSGINSAEKTSTAKCFQLPAYVNPQGVRFTSGEEDDMEGGRLKFKKNKNELKHSIYLYQLP